MRLSLTLLLTLCTIAQASDWARFRGPAGSGISPDETPTPVTWSDAENLKWSAKLPGPGLSCPIVHGERVFITSWVGYEAGEGSSNNIDDLKRVLLCLNRRTGDVLWSKDVPAVQPEDEFAGMFAENGYATHTPACDGERVFAFFGKTGVVAFDMDGQQLWQQGVGTGSGAMGWGTASSPVLFENLVIVTAAAESNAIVALDKSTGKEVWRREGDSLSGTWSTPILVAADGRQELVLALPKEVWALNPATGELRWTCTMADSNLSSASVVAKDGVVYCMGGDAVAVRSGGEGDVSDSRVIWRERHKGGIGSPIVYGDHLYWFGGGVANCVRLEDGKEVYKERLTAAEGGGGRGRGQDYSSPVAADGKLYFVDRSGTCHVVQAGPEFKQLAANKFASDSGQYSASPAVLDGQIFIRSTDRLYCVQAR